MNKYNGKEVSADGYKESDCSLIEIPVPWGIVSGKTWGQKTDVPLILLHGMQDNCGSFDCLIPLLPKEYFFVCLDLPGHGWSSDFPDDFPLDLFNYVLSVKLVIDHYGMTHFYMIGHSLGAQISLFFSALYPEYVLKVILLDGVPIVTRVKDSAVFLRKKIDDIIEYTKKKSLKKSPPSYSYKEALERFRMRDSNFTEKSAQILLKRGLIRAEEENRYYFSFNQRIKLKWINLLSNSQLKAIILSVKCPVLFILVKETYDKYTEMYIGKNTMIRMLLYGHHNLDLVTVSGHHDIHLDNAQVVAAPIKSFLKTKSKL